MCNECGSDVDEDDLDTLVKIGRRCSPLKCGGGLWLWETPAETPTEIPEEPLEFFDAFDAPDNVKQEILEFFDAYDAELEEFETLDVDQKSLLSEKPSELPSSTSLSSSMNNPKCGDSVSKGLKIAQRWRSSAESERQSNMLWSIGVSVTQT